MRPIPIQSLVVDVFLFAATLAACGGQAPAGHECFHFKESQPLTIDVQRIAVWAPEANAGDQDAALQTLGIEPANVRPLAVHWRLARVPVASRSPEGIDQLVQQVAMKANMADQFVSPVFIDNFGGPLIVTQDVLLQFRWDVTPDAAEHILFDAGAETILDRNWAHMTGAYRVRMKSHNGFDVLTAANALAVRADVLYAEPDLLFTGRGAAATIDPPLPTDPLFPIQWGLNNTGQSILTELCGVQFTATAGFDVNAPEAWEITTGDAAIIIVIIDDGVELTHPDLMIDAALGADMTGENGGGWPVNPCDNHGTSVAGIPAALINNGLGGAGVSPSCRVASVRPFISAASCDGGWTSQASWTVNALDWAQSIGARVTNNSSQYGFTASSIDAKYEHTRSAGMVHFAAAGNEGLPQIGYPASLCSVNAVAWLTPFGLLQVNSNYGDGLAFSAPGGRIITTDRTGSDGYSTSDNACFTGTSAASPVAAGVAALILSMNPSLSAYQVERIMQRSARDVGAQGYDTGFGWGIVDAYAALTSPPFALADISGDGQVGINDLVSVITSWGPCPGICPAPCPADVTGDRLVNIDDLVIVITHWG